MRVLLLCLVVAAPAQAGPSKPFCGEKTECRQMADCAEAQFHYSQCGETRLDRDGDGVPCEELCRFK